MSMEENQASSEISPLEIENQVESIGDIPEKQLGRCCACRYCACYCAYAVKRHTGWAILFSILALILVAVAIVSSDSSSSGSDNIGLPASTVPTPNDPTNSGDGQEPTANGDCQAVASEDQIGPDILGAREHGGFGKTVALSGNGRVVAGGSVVEDYVEGGTGAGEVRVFDIDHEKETILPKGIPIQGKGPNEDFGAALALSADGMILAVGADQQHDFDCALDDCEADGHYTRGLVRVYQFTDARQWEQLGSDILAENDSEISGNQFGQAISLSADGMTIAVGDSWDSTGEHIRAGKVQVFRYNMEVSDWERLGNVLLGQTEFNFLGASVDLSDDGNILAVAASTPASLSIYLYSGTSWALLGDTIEIEQPPNYPNDVILGEAVSLSGNGQIAALSVSGDGLTEMFSGSVYIFEFDGTTWKAKGELLKDDILDDEFGRSLSLAQDGLVLAAGAAWGPGVPGGDADFTGCVSVFRWNDNEWKKQWEQYGLPGCGTLGETFGTAVSISSDGSKVAVGAPGNTVSGKKFGRISVFRTNGED